MAAGAAALEAGAARLPGRAPSAAQPGPVLPKAVDSGARLLPLRPWPGEGISTLAAQLPERLSQLSLDLGSCALGDSGAEILAKHMPQRLSRLNLQLGNTEMSESGLLAIARALPKQLSQLQLGVAYLAAQSDCLLSLSPSLPKFLAKLVLDLRCCRVGTKGLAVLAHSLGPNLAQLELDFQKCELPTDARQGFLGALLAKRLLGSSTWKQLSQYSYFQKNSMQAIPMWSYKARADDEINLTKGVKVDVDRIAPGWWTGTVDGQSGFFPGNYVKLADRAISRFDLETEDDEKPEESSSSSHWRIGRGASTSASRMA
ncbi:unnamed protein product [Effrenium voratum]|nr:unnamed protein product [Effrenium voratum]